MSKSNFIFAYTGRKKKFENAIVFKHINFTNITTIVEPFGGSMSFCQYLYIEKGMKGLKYIYNDLDTNIFNFMTFIKQKGMCGLVELCEYSNKQTPKHDKTTQTKVLPLIEYFSSKANGNDSAFLKQRRKDPTKYAAHVDFIQHIDEITNVNYADIFDKYKGRGDVLIYLDPPYMKNYNTDYQPQNTNKASDMTQIMVDIIELFKHATCHIAYIYSKNAMMDYLFADIPLAEEYNKIYQTTKKTCTHCIRVK